MSDLYWEGFLNIILLVLVFTFKFGKVFTFNIQPFVLSLKFLQLPELINYSTYRLDIKIFFSIISLTRLLLCWWNLSGYLGCVFKIQRTDRLFPGPTSFIREFLRRLDDCYFKVEKVFLKFVFVLFAEHSLQLRILVDNLIFLIQDVCSYWKNVENSLRVQATTDICENFPLPQGFLSYTDRWEVISMLVVDLAIAFHFTEILLLFKTRISFKDIWEV